jgi:transposase
MAGKAARVTLTETMYETLQRLATSRMIARSISIRIWIVLLALKKYNNTKISEIVGLGRQPVGLWRRRWQQSYEALLAIELNETTAEFERSLISVFSDAPRCGSPGKFTPEQIIGIISIACEPPSHSGRPVTTWTGRELADEAIIRGLVVSISASQVNRFLADADHQPHRSKYWCFTTEKNREEFALQVETVCHAYLDAPMLYHSENTHTVCVDELTSLQANERRAETKPARPGQIAKIECQYKRHGTICVTGNWHVVQGQMIATTIDETRNNRDFANHIEQTIDTDPDAGWVFILDNLNTHCGDDLVRMVARKLGIDADTLGKAKKRGILKSMKTRRAFLSDLTHPIRFVYLPKHSSWLNQVEVIFGIIARRVIRGGSFTSQADLKQKLLAFIEYFNRTYAKPMNWTYNGRPTKNKKQQRPRTWREEWLFKRLAQKLTLVNG